MTALELSTRHVDAAIDKAAAEALDNASLLALGGCFEAALETARALIGPGPWQIGRKGTLFRRLEADLPWLCWLNRVRCEAVGAEPARDVVELDARSREMAAHQINHLTMIDRVQQQPAGEGWSEPWFERLLQSTDGLQERRRAHGRFCGDVLWILKSRSASGLRSVAGAGPRRR